MLCTSKSAIHLLVVPSFRNFSRTFVSSSTRLSRTATKSSLTVESTKQQRIRSTDPQHTTHQPKHSPPHIKMTSSTPSFRLINGTDSSKIVRQQVATRVAQLTSTAAPAPTLAVILVGSRKDSQTYVNMKTKACDEVKITAQQFNLPADSTQTDLSTLIHKLNVDPLVNGILIQLPLPSHLDSDALISQIDPLKDVDGLTATNAGDLLRSGSAASLIPCTPLGCMELLRQYDISCSGKHAVVLGRSNLVGKPIAQLLLSEHATVTLCHSRTADLKHHLLQADIVVAAIGKANFVKSEWLKKGAVVIDVGINAVDDSSRKSGYRLVGDCEFDSCSAVASAMTPVPGGVGPMTVAMLLKNTVKAYEMQHKKMQPNNTKQ